MWNGEDGDALGGGDGDGGPAQFAFGGREARTVSPVTVEPGANARQVCPPLVCTSACVPLSSNVTLAPALPQLDGSCTVKALVPVMEWLMQLTPPTLMPSVRVPA